MFVDSIKIRLSSGNGGAGASSFRREKHVPLGGPDGGDGGRGGDVVIICDNNLHTLAHFKGKTHLKADNGDGGLPRNKNGKKGANLEIKVPIGTQIINLENNEILHDFTTLGEQIVLLKGGLGGLGNRHFKSAVNQRPTYAQPGKKGESIEVRLELKLIADVGLVGYPNVGKSTLISIVSNAKPEIADYEFTTLTPKLGVVDINDYSFVMADIPGIIEGASEGKGLGFEFLKHISRSKCLLFMLDSFKQMSVKEQFINLYKELETYGLNDFKFAVAITRCDVAKENLDQEIELLNEYLKRYDNLVFVTKISSVTNDGIKELKLSLSKMLFE